MLARMYQSLIRPVTFFALALGVASVIPSRSAEAQESLAIRHAELLPGWRTDLGTRMAAFRIELAPGWKTYWRAPGDTGIPPQFDWSGSTNVASVRIHWPRPMVFDINGMQQIGYHDRLVLPLEVTPRDPALPVRLAAHIALGVCQDICVPASLVLSADLDGPDAPDKAISAALKARPDSAAEAGLVSISCAVAPIDDGLSVNAQIGLPDQGGPETVIFETADASVWVAPSVSSRAGGLLTARSDMVAASGAPFALDRSGMTVTVLGRNGAVEIHGCPAAD